jgi:lysophospholipase L1-like esterase
MWSRRFIAHGFVAALSAAVVFLTACNDSGDDEGSKPSDFGDNDANTVLCMGDSLTKGTCAPAGAPYPDRVARITGKRVVNAGVCGARAMDGADRVTSQLAKHKPGYLLILYGANDATSGTGLGALVADLRAMILAAKANKTFPIIGTLTPMYDEHGYGAGRAREMSAEIRNLAKQEGVPVADLESEFGGDRALIQPDGLHPSDAGTELMAVVFADRL